MSVDRLEKGSQVCLECAVAWLEKLGIWSIIPGGNLSQIPNSYFPHHIPDCQIISAPTEINGHNWSMTMHNTL